MDPVEKAICKYKFHPSILLFKMENVQNIDPKMAVTKSGIPPERLKLNCCTFVETLQNLFNECLTTGNFSDNLKLAYINPVFEKKNPLKNENYKAVSVLPSISKTFEKHMQKRINGYINSFYLLIYSTVGEIIVHS